MNELHWPPAVIRQLSISQLVCLLSDRPPGRGKIQTPEDYAAASARVNDW